jgi:hypothetical protein
MSKLYNLARMTTATTGTGTITLGVAVSGYLTFANAGVQNGDVLFYGINDGAASEVGWGTYTASGTTLSRNVIKSTNSNTAINLDGSAQVYVTALASDGGDLMPSFDHPMRGFDSAVNLQLNVSVASNILTVAVKGNNGSDPGNSNPVLVPFRDATIANGDPVWVAITSALSINTSATGATLGTSGASTPFRFWVVLFNNGGTAVLGLVNCTASGQIFALDETSAQSTTAMSASATSAGVFYTPNGTTLASKAFRIIGYVEYSSGLTTAGTYASAPTKVQLFGPGVPRPGQPTGNMKTFATTTNTSTSSASAVASAVTTSMTLASAANSVEVVWSGSIQSTNGSIAPTSLYRGNAAVTTQLGPVPIAESNGGQIISPAGGIWLDTPFAGGTTTAAYTVGFWSSGGATTVNFPNDGISPANGTMYLKEIMG